jgi:hypothetical protein
LLTDFYLRLYVSGCVLILLPLMGIVALARGNPSWAVCSFIGTGICVAVDLVWIVTGTIRDADGYAVTKWI